MTQAVIVYGVKTCTTVRLHVKLLKEQGYDVTFYDYLSQGVDQDMFKRAIKQLGWDKVVNLRARNFSSLVENDKEYLKKLMAEQNHEFDAQGYDIVCQNPRIIKRPLVEKNGEFSLNVD
ncbi:thioredoxin domain-containing protein [Psittacicella hinzii]|uniref:Arsenate reductase n=1 Tax=Psittacicella hinzii TaxID=2028575 RepID=A0A3A1YMZ3_9GAMM|nr:hypothetical protein [Psittacicella hinzii]RIY38609.1 hypothetical protein CKF58_03850 [Psittacicella hinzii]